jgi:hypothetical protein
LFSPERSFGPTSTPATSLDLFIENGFTVPVPSGFELAKIEWKLRLGQGDFNDKMVDKQNIHFLHLCTCIITAKDVFRQLG